MNEHQEIKSLLCQIHVQFFTIFEFLSGPTKQCTMSKRGKFNYDILIFVFLWTNTMSSINGFFRNVSLSLFIHYFFHFCQYFFLSFSSQGMLVILRHVLWLYYSLLPLESSRSEHFVRKETFSRSLSSSLIISLILSLKISFINT